MRPSSGLPLHELGSHAYPRAPLRGRWRRARAHGPRGRPYAVCSVTTRLAKHDDQGIFSPRRYYTASGRVGSRQPRLVVTLGTCYVGGLACLRERSAFVPARVPIETPGRQRVAGLGARRGCHLSGLCCPFRCLDLHGSSSRPRKSRCSKRPLEPTPQHTGRPSQARHRQLQTAGRKGARVARIRLHGCRASACRLGGPNPGQLCSLVGSVGRDWSGQDDALTLYIRQRLRATRARHR